MSKAMEVKRAKSYFSTVKSRVLLHNDGGLKAAFERGLSLNASDCFYVGKSPLLNAGQGCFAKHLLPRETPLSLIVGEYVATKSQPAERQSYSFDLDSPRFRGKVCLDCFDATDATRFINCSSIQANVRVYWKGVAPVLWSGDEDIEPDAELRLKYTMPTPTVCDVTSMSNGVLLRGDVLTPGLSGIPGSPAPEGLRLPAQGPAAGLRDSGGVERVRRLPHLRGGVLRVLRRFDPAAAGRDGHLLHAAGFRGGLPRGIPPPRSVASVVS